MWLKKFKIHSFSSTLQMPVHFIMALLVQENITKSMTWSPFLQFCCFKQISFNAKCLFKFEASHICNSKSYLVIDQRN